MLSHLKSEKPQILSGAVYFHTLEEKSKFYGTSNGPSCHERTTTNYNYIQTIFKFQRPVGEVVRTMFADQNRDKHMNKKSTCLAFGMQSLSPTKLGMKSSTLTRFLGVRRIEAPLGGAENLAVTKPLKLKPQ